MQALEVGRAAQECLVSGEMFNVFGEHDALLLKIHARKTTLLEHAAPLFPCLQVISLDTIIRREYIVPDFAVLSRLNTEPKFFHVSAFKWNRPPTDRAGFESQ